MKILFVLPAYEPAWAFGGVVRCASNLCRAMARAGADVSVYTTNVDGLGALLSVSPQGLADLGGVMVTYFPSTFGRNSAFDSRALSRALDTTIGRFDVIYVSAVYQWIGLSAGRIARRNGTPYIVGTHGSFHPVTLEKGRLKKGLYWHLFLKRCIEGATALHFTTEYERRVSVPLLPRVESFVVANTVPVEPFASSPPPNLSLRGQYGIDPENAVLLTVTRPHPDKRLDVLVQAFEKIEKKVPGTRLLIVGPCDNAYMEEIKKLADALEVGEKIVWKGYQVGEALEACYWESDLFMLPSAHENFSMVAAEAMAKGIPVIVSEHVGVAEDVQRHDAGFVAPIDPAEFARSALELLDDRDRMRQMGKRAREAALELYSGDRVARLILRAFEDVISGQRSEACAWR